MPEKPKPQDLRQRRATEDDDVEGHNLLRPDGMRHAKVADPDGLLRRATEDDDVEGHGMRIRSPSSKGE